MKTTQHTLNLPLKLVYYSNAWEIREANNALVLHIPAGKDDIEAMAGAQFIVKACNSHHELLQTVKELRQYADLKLTWLLQDYPDDHCMVQTAISMVALCDAAIKSAQGKE